jgi:ElaB/YqjD/DUF883 family membrane-anchored ribosome-binding protein
MADKILNQDKTETERIVRVLHDALDRLAEQAGGAEEQVRDSAESVRERVRSTKQQVRARSNEAANAVDDYVDDHPWAAVGIAFGAGIILSSILRR